MLDIQNVRLKRHMTQRQLANEIGKSMWTVRSWELGRRHPKPSDLEALAAALGASVGDLFRSDEPDPKKIEESDSR